MAEPQHFLRGADLWVLVDATFPYTRQNEKTGKVETVHAAMVDGVLVCSQECYDKLKEQCGGAKQ